MNTHDIERLIDRIEASPAMDIAGRSKHIHDLRAAIEADRKRRGEPVAWSGWGCQYPGKMPRLYGDRSIAEVNCDRENGDQLLYLTAAPQPAEPIKDENDDRLLHPDEPVVKESLTVAETVKDAVRIYNSGYMAGHQDTVEGCFADILSADMASYHEDVVSELVGALRDHQLAEPVEVPIDSDELSVAYFCGLHEGKKAKNTLPPVKPDPHYEEGSTDVFEHAQRQAYVDGWNECLEAIRKGYE